MAELEAIKADQESKIDTYQLRQREYETERRKLHNIIQELKGNIRVFCRVRPLLPEDVAGKSTSKSFDGCISHITFSGDKSLEIIRAAGRNILASNWLK